jgi:uncharacterized protein YcgI (DUF1989 family)
MNMQAGALSALERRLKEQPLTIPGVILSDQLVAPRGFLPAIGVGVGEVVRVIDVSGGQVVDVMLFADGGTKHPSSCATTTAMNGTVKITRGHTVYSKYGRELADIAADTVGDNFFGGGFCAPEKNARRFGVAGTPSCRTNLAASLAAFRVSELDLELDACFALFMRANDHLPDFVVEPPRSVAGDYVELRALDDVVMAMSNCPSERNACNAWNPTHVRVVHYRPEQQAASSGRSPT